MTCFEYYRFDIPLTGKVSTKWRIVLEAIVGSQEIGDITIDDLVFRDGCILSDNQSLPPGTTPAPTPSPCPEGQFVCGDKSCINSSSV